MKITLDHYQPDTTFQDKWLSEADRLRYLEMEEKKKHDRETAHHRVRKVSKSPPKTGYRDLRN